MIKTQTFLRFKNKNLNDIYMYQILLKQFRERKKDKNIIYNIIFSKKKV